MLQQLIKDKVKEYKAYYHITEDLSKAEKAIEKELQKYLLIDFTIKYINKESFGVNAKLLNLGFGEVEKQIEQYIN